MKPTAASAGGQVRLAPQKGPQTAFLASQADIAIYGGAAGGGKSWALLVDPLRHFQTARFGAVIFRRTSMQVRVEGGLWDASGGIYTLFGAEPRQNTLEWRFPSGISISFGGLEYEDSVLDWSGSEIPYIGFDELQLFTSKQFWFMLSRNRSTSGVKSRVRATCNPQSEGWLRDLISWWIDPMGFPIPERSGVLRWFVREDGAIHWADDPETLKAAHPKLHPKSLTFIPAKLADNQVLMRSDPGYLANLMALSPLERGQLLDGNWNIKPSAGTVFRRHWFEVIDEVRANVTTTIRAWDLAATPVTQASPNPDWARGVKLGRLHTGKWVVLDVVSIRGTALEVERLVTSTASQDGYATAVVIEQEPGSAGKSVAERYVTLLAGYNVRIRKPDTDKVTRALPVSAQSEAGNVLLLRASWNDPFLTELEAFPDGGHDDQVDALSSAFNEFAQMGSYLIGDIL